MHAINMQRRLDGESDQTPYVGEGPRVVTIYVDTIHDRIMVNLDVGLGSHTFPFTKDLAEALRDAADQVYPRED